MVPYTEHSTVPARSKVVAFQQWQSSRKQAKQSALKLGTLQASLMAQCAVDEHEDQFQVSSRVEERGGRWRGGGGGGMPHGRRQSCDHCWWSASGGRGSQPPTRRACCHPMRQLTRMACAAAPGRRPTLVSCWLRRPTAASSPSPWRWSPTGKRASWCPACKGPGVQPPARLVAHLQATACSAWGCGASAAQGAGVPGVSSPHWCRGAVRAQLRGVGGQLQPRDSAPTVVKSQL